MNLESRLFIGYVEPANRLEVISFNERLGRFEFQVVTDYKAGGTAKTFYAPRSLCTACHQAQAPIFSENVWSETNRNPFMKPENAARRAEMIVFMTQLNH